MQKTNRNDFMRSIHDRQDIFIDSAGGFENNGNAAYANAAGIAVLKSRRMSRQNCGYFFVRRHGTPFIGRAVRGSASCVGSLTRYCNPYGSVLPDCSRGERKNITAVKEAIMPRAIRRAMRALFPLHTIPVSTVTTQAEARALAGLLSDSGKRALFYPAPAGFTVAEVTA